MRPPGRRLPRSVRAVALGALFLLLPACAGDAASEQGSEIATFYDVVFVLAVLVFLGVNGALIHFVIKYRRKPTDVDMPPQIHGNTTAEVVWTVIPSLVVLGLFGMSWSSMRSIDSESKTEPAVLIEAQGAQWAWQFNYGDNLVIKQRAGSTDPPELHLPIGEPVRFSLVSPDVIHAFYVPEFFFKKDVVPGKVNTFDITVDKVGTYHGQCAEFCGTEHSKMIFKVKATSRADFDEWRKTAKAAACEGQPAEAVEIKSPPNTIAFDKDCVVVPANKDVKLTYTNEGGELHNVAVTPSANELGTVLGKSGDPIGSGTQTGTVKAQPPGSYYYYCQVHPAMNGTWKVQ